MALYRTGLAMAILCLAGTLVAYFSGVFSFVSVAVLVAVVLVVFSLLIVYHAKKAKQLFEGRT